MALILGMAVPILFGIWFCICHIIKMYSFKHVKRFLREINGRRVERREVNFEERRGNRGTRGDHENGGRRAMRAMGAEIVHQKLK